VALITVRKARRYNENQIRVNDVSVPSCISSSLQAITFPPRQFFKWNSWVSFLDHPVYHVILERLIPGDNISLDWYFNTTTKCNPLETLKQDLIRDTDNLVVAFWTALYTLSLPIDYPVDGNHVINYLTPSLFSIKILSYILILPLSQLQLQ